MKILETDKTKVLLSGTYNYFFYKKTGEFIRFGKTLNDNPDYSEYGPEIADIEIVSGRCSGRCDFCYKSNGVGDVKYMNLTTFKNLLNKFPKTLTQIAFGITDFYANPDFIKILEHTRDEEIIPNYTTSGFDIDDNAVSATVKYCGGVAVSIVDKDVSYNTIKKFTNAGMKQVNIHFMLSEETYQEAFKVLKDIKTDSRLSGLTAIVFLSVKQKGKGKSFTSIKSVEKYKLLIDMCKELKINHGFDSCSAPLYMQTVTDTKILNYVECCESSLFSAYVNVDGMFFPCSFTEEGEGVDVLKCDNFLNDVWFNPKTVAFREKLLSTSKGCNCEFSSECRSCPAYDITPCKKLNKTITDSLAELEEMEKNYTDILRRLNEG